MTTRFASQAIAMKAAIKPDERRQFGRRATQRQAWIVVAGQRRASCCISNTSEGGALLELSVPSGLPTRFNLVVDDLGISVPCELRHQTTTTLGVLFLDLALGARLNGTASAVSARSPTPATIDPAPILATRPVTVILLPALPLLVE